MGETTMTLEQATARVAELERQLGWVKSEDQKEHDRELAAAHAERDALRSQVDRLEEEGRKGSEASMDWASRVDALTAAVAAQPRELERHRHGTTIEGDGICPDSLEVADLRAQIAHLADQVALRDEDRRRLDAEVLRAAETARGLAAQVETLTRDRDWAVGVQRAALESQERLAAETRAATERAEKAEREATRWREDHDRIAHAAMMAAEATRSRETALREALEAAATSLETISETAGTGELAEMYRVRGYAWSRATVARAALASEAAPAEPLACVERHPDWPEGPHEHCPTCDAPCDLTPASEAAGTGAGKSADICADCGMTRHHHRWLPHTFQPSPAPETTKGEDHE